MRLAGHGVRQGICLSYMAGCSARSSAAICCWTRRGRISVSLARRLYIGEMVLAVGALGVLAATGYLRIPVRDEPILAVLAAFFLWGFIRFLPGFRAYGI